MKFICHVDDDIEESDMILLGRAISSLRKNKPEGLGAIGFEGSKFEASWIKNKSSYSLYARLNDAQTQNR
jgi:hypothetical protein